MEWIMIALLAWQVTMPAVNNAKFAFSIDSDGSIVRMNTQTGVMERCTKELVCKQEEEKNAK